MWDTLRTAVVQLRAYEESLAEYDSYKDLKGYDAIKVGRTIQACKIAREAITDFSVNACIYLEVEDAEKVYK